MSLCALAYYFLNSESNSLWYQKTLPLGVTACCYLKNDFVGQKFLEFILGQGVKENLCEDKPGGHCVLHKTTLGKARQLGPLSIRCRNDSPRHDS